MPVAPGDAGQSASSKIYALGRVEGQTREVELRPQLAGRVDAVAVTEGHVVEAGDNLLQLDDALYRYEVQSAIAAVELAKGQLQRLLNGPRQHERIEAKSLYEAKLARLRNAQRRYDRATQLHQAEAVPQREVDDMQSELDALYAEVQASRARMETVLAKAREDEVRIAQIRIHAAQARAEFARVQFDRMRIRAPQSGQVLKVNVESGELAGPASVNPAIILVDTSKMNVRAFVEELDAPRVELGSKVEVTADGLDGEVFHGVVTSLSPRMGRKTLWSDRPNERQDTKTREVIVTLTNHDKLFVGMQVDVVIGTPSPESGEP